MPPVKRPQDHRAKATKAPTVLSPLSPDVAAFLLGQINSLTLNVGAPDFDEAMTMVLKARGQLLAIAPQPNEQETRT